MHKNAQQIFIFLGPGVCKTFSTLLKILITSVNLNNELSSPTAQMGLKLCRYNEVI